MTAWGFVDVASPAFWAFVAFSVLIVNVIADEAWRRRARALLNVGFVMLVVGWTLGLYVVMGLVLFYTMTRPSVLGLRARIAVTGLSLATLFLLHKLSPQPLAEWSLLKQALVGVGFSYVALRSVEVLRAAAARDLVGIELADTINYLIPFHMLTAGPIQAFADFRRYRTHFPQVDRDAAFEGVERIARGLFKKFVLADGVVKILFLTGFESQGLYWLLEVQFYCLYVYLDFSAYTDIAVGVGRLLGVPTPENFRNPLAARNIIVFWERWHISLSQFVRRNVFIPIQLAGMRRTQGHFHLAVAAVAFTVAFLLVGLWHEISWRFAAWGGLHALALIVCSLYRSALAARLSREGFASYMAHPLPRAIATVLTFEFVAFSLFLVARPMAALAR